MSLKMRQKFPFHNGPFVELKSLTCYKCYLDIGTITIESVPHPRTKIWFLWKKGYCVLNMARQDRFQESSDCVISKNLLHFLDAIHCAIFENMIAIQRWWTLYSDAFNIMTSCNFPDSTPGYFLCFFLFKLCPFVHLERQTEPNAQHSNGQMDSN